MENKKIYGHILAIITIIIWGTTFISTKILLREFSPVEILFFRFIVGFVALWLVYPHPLKGTNKKQELYFAVASLCGITLYFLFENIALTYTLASNVGIIISIAPFFTAILANWLLDGEKLSKQFSIGFVFAVFGIALISFNGNVVLKLNPIGDVLAILAAIIWAVYSILVKKISDFGYNTIQSTRRIFAYGLLFMIPVLFIFNFKIGIMRFAQPVLLFNIIYLGLGASAICFVTWSVAVKVLGAVKTSVYIYLTPIVTVITSVIVLNEKITWFSVMGIAFTMIGLLVSESKISVKLLRKKQLN